MLHFVLFEAICFIILSPTCVSFSVPPCAFFCPPCVFLFPPMYFFLFLIPLQVKSLHRGVRWGWGTHLPRPSWDFFCHLYDHLYKENCKQKLCLLKQFGKSSTISSTILIMFSSWNIPMVLIKRF